MKLIIAGGRDFEPKVKHLKWLDWLKPRLGHIEEVVHGDARGADTFGASWARANRIPVKPFPVTREEWERIGKRAGHIRNRRMAVYVGNAGAVVLFPGGRGTQSMFEIAVELNLKIYDWRFRE